MSLVSFVMREPASSEVPRSNDHRGPVDSARPAGARGSVDSARPAALRVVRGNDGVALLLVLMVLLAVGAMGLAAIAVSGNAGLVTMYESRQDELESVADAGLELARASVNGTRGLFPDSGFVALENGVNVFDAAGRLIPDVRRYTYVGPTGVATGQYGVFGSIVSVAEAPNGDRVIRRGDVMQESFAKYAYFTDREPSNIAFGSGDQIQGPVHTNDFLKIYNSGATFRGPGAVTTAKTIEGRQYGVFREGYEENVGRIELPETAELDRLRGYATRGGTAFVAPNGGTAQQARLRIEFVTQDLNGDGDGNDADEGFFRVYQSNQPAWLMALSPGNAGWPSSANCGYWDGVAREFVTPKKLTDRGEGNTSKRRAPVMRAGESRCYLGGDPMITGNGVFQARQSQNDFWIERPFAMQGNPPAALTNRPDFAHLFPLGRRFNPDFKGVVHVTGRVALSGTVRGRLTIAATDRIFLVDDLRYANDPGGGTCIDIVGLFSGSDVMVTDNTLNTPQRPDPNNNAFFTYDETRDEFVHGVVLALNNFTVENYQGGPTNWEACEATSRGRGCLYLSGGVIQSERGGVGTTGGTGYLKRYSYDACAASSPPPYFPTTGRFGKARYYEVDPVGFDPETFYERWTAGG